ncbi:hypothetical protein BDZ45DRAFT_749091 [Acephala macrosclerotiorum]|nr:hypothetical protein BDZ45DRAFT_749091 [Acephala macrosclerotiorum]
MIFSCLKSTLLIALLVLSPFSSLALQRSPPIGPTRSPPATFSVKSELRWTVEVMFLPQSHSDDLPAWVQYSDKGTFKSDSPDTIYISNWN